MLFGLSHSVVYEEVEREVVDTLCDMNKNEGIKKNILS